MCQNNKFLETYFSENMCWMQQMYGQNMATDLDYVLGDIYLSDWANVYVPVNS